MEFPHAFFKRFELGEHAAREQVGLREERATFQLAVVAFGHDPLHELLHALQIFQQQPLDVVAALLVVGNVLEILQRPVELSLLRSLAAVNRCRERTPRPTVRSSRTLSRRPATARTKASMSCWPTSFMRMNGRSVYM